MPLPDPIRRLIEAGRRRLAMTWLFSAVVVAVAVAGAMAALLVGVSQVFVVLWAEPVAWALVVIAGSGAVIATLTRIPTRERAALEIDRRLGGFDRVMTALELTASATDLSESERRAVESAEVWSTGRGIDGLGSVIPRRPLPYLAALTLAATLVLSLLPSVTDSAVAEVRADRERIATEADRIDDLAEDAPQNVATDLEALAEELRSADTVPEALELLGEAREELLAALDPGELAKKTALSGLEQSLASDPIAGGATAADQLESLIGDLDDLSYEDAMAAADQLAERSEDFAGVDEELSEALKAAARGLQVLANGGTAREATEDALQTAADATRRVSDEVVESGSRAAAAGDLRDAQRRLDGGAGSDPGTDGQGAGQGQGQGSGDGQGQGQGSGTGQGDGQGQGQGQGSGGAGGGQGQGGQSGSGTGDGSGSGQVPSGSGDDDPFAEPSRSQIFDPADFSAGEKVRIPIDGRDPGDLLGTTTGTGIDNDAVVPYGDRFTDYRSTALNSLDALTIPSSLEAIVRDYFTRLEP